jgi:Fe-S cluster biogenesis protein NfuA
MKPDFQKGLERIEEQIQLIESVADPHLKASTLELVQSLIALHGAGIERLLELIANRPDGQALIDELGDDEMVSSLLVLHGLHPLDVATRVKHALDKVGPYLASHGGSVELLGISDDGVVRLRLLGSCQSCSSSTATLKLAIEEAIHQFAPDVVKVEAEGVEAEPSTGVIQITRASTFA